ncbi:MAG: hypothetical protein ACLQU3_02020 [Limisphaerales bacterium]
MKKHLTVLLTTCALVGALSAGLTLARAQTTTPGTPPAGATSPEHKGNERHPAIHRAIRALEEAKLALERAGHDFGGHRKAALEECDKAIAQLKLALQYDKK